MARAVSDQTAQASRREGAQGRSVSWATLALVSLAFLLAFALRIWALDSLSPELEIDEAWYAFDAAEVLRGERPVFFQANIGREPAFIYLVALGEALLGPGVLAARFTALAISLLTVAMTFALARRLFDHRVALVAAFAVATAFWAVNFGRLAYRAGSLPLFLLLGLYPFWRAVSDEGPARPRLRWYALAGLGLGLSLYSYTPARLVPALIALFLAGQALTRPRWLWRERGGLLLCAALAAATMAPLAAFFLAHQDQLVERSAEVSIITRLPPPPNEMARLGRNAVDNLQMFWRRGDRSDWHNVGAEPLLDPAAALLFALGVAVVLVQLRRPRSQLLLLWLALMLLPSVLSRDSPSYRRAVGALPPTFILVGLGAVAILAAAGWALRQRWQGRFPSAAMAVALLLLGAWWTAWHGARYLRWATAEDTAKAFRTEALPVYQPALNLYRWSQGGDTIVLPPPEEGPARYPLSFALAARSPLLHAFLPPDRALITLTGLSGEPVFGLFELSPQHLAALRRQPPPRPLAANLDNQVDLRGYDLRRLDGGGWELRLFWQIRRASAEETVLYVHAVADDGAVWWKRDDRAYFSTLWRGGEQVVSRYVVPAPPPGRAPAELRVGLWSLERSAARPLRDPEGEAVGGAATIRFPPAGAPAP